jgi:Flp pilus assembly protein TadG
VEFAIVLPVMAAVLAGTADYGRFAATSIAVCNASRAFMTACRSKVEEEFSAVPGFDPQQLQIEITSEGTWPRARVRVAVNYPFQTVINWGFLPSSVPVSRTTVLPMVR